MKTVKTNQQYIYLDELSLLFFIIVFVHFLLNWIHNIYSFTMDLYIHICTVVAYGKVSAFSIPSHVPSQL